MPSRPASSPRAYEGQRDLTVGRSESRALEHVACCVCDADDPAPVAVGEDYEYRTSDDTFLMVRCRRCGLLYLNPRPSATEFERIYPPNYHAFTFTAAHYGFVYRIRRRLEAARMLKWCRGLPPAARIVDVGCGDGFHLDALRRYGPPGYRLEGIELDRRAADAARARGLTVHHGALEELSLDDGNYDAAFAIQTLEHVSDPPAFLAQIARLLRPGGRLTVVTDNAASLDSYFFRERYWGGYHFPRHFNLFTASTLARVAERSGLQVESVETLVSPVNWVYSLRNALVDMRAPRALVERFSLSAPETLVPFTLLDMALTKFGRGALLCATLRR